MLSPYPLVYTPKGSPKPTCCPHVAPNSVIPGKGPDARLDANGDPIDAGGLCWGGALSSAPATGWIQTHAGWWINLTELTPEHLKRSQPHRAVARWRTVAGVLPGHAWRVPVLISPTLADAAITWDSALDRLYSPAGWQDPADLVALIAPLRALALESTSTQGTDDATSDALARLAVDLLTVGYHLDGDLLGAAGWLSLSTMSRILIAACDQVPHAAL